MSEVETVKIEFQIMGCCVDGEYETTETMMNPCPICGKKDANIDLYGDLHDDCEGVENYTIKCESCLSEFLLVDKSAGNYNYDNWKWKIK